MECEWWEASGVHFVFVVDDISFLASVVCFRLVAREVGWNTATNTCPGEYCML